MLHKIQPNKVRAHGGRFAIVASRYNARYVDAMLAAARRELKRAGAKTIQVVRVPGAYEIPVVVKRLARLSTLNPSAFAESFGATAPKRSEGGQPSTCFVIAHTHIPAAENFARVSVIPHDAEAFARAIYAELHRCDAAGAELIVVEAPPESPEWAGIADRLRRAAA